MGTWYHYAVVHNRVLVWWTDDNGTEREEWFWGEEAERFMKLEDTANTEIQKSLYALARTKMTPQDGNNG